MKLKLYKTLILAFLFIGFTSNLNAKTLPSSFADLAEKLIPSVVNISTTQTITTNTNPFPFQFPPGSPFEDLFKDFETPQKRKASALGSGFIIDVKGIVITNNHVIKGAEDIIVRVDGEKEFEAKVIGADPLSDIAVLKIESKEKFIPVKFGDSDKSRIGDWVLAIGNPFGLGGTVTSGIISARNRSIGLTRYEDFIQTDAAINPGNSGGALLNMDGDLIGINTAIATGGYEKGNRGVGFAIPSNMAQRIMSDLIDKGYVTRSWLGVIIQELDNETAEALDIETRNGALIADVVKDSPAEDAGMQEGDVIVEFNGKPIANTANLKNVVSLTAPESTNRVKVIRNGSPKTVKVTLQELPENPQQYAIRQRNESNEFGLELKKITDSLKEKYQIEEEDALVVTRIDPNGEAYGKGIREGDIIKRIGTERVRSLKDYNRLLEKAKVKGTVLVLVKKPGGSSRYYTLSYQ